MQTRRKITALGSAAALVLAVVTVPAITAHAQPNPVITGQIDVDPATEGSLFTEPILPWTFEDAEAPGGGDVPPICDDPAITLGGQDVSDLVVITDEFTGTIDLRGFAADYNEVVFECEEYDYSLYFAFVRFTVTKDVEGDAPEDAQFTFRATQTGELGAAQHSDSVEWTMGAGESQEIVSGLAGTWEFEELDDAGAADTKWDYDGSFADFTEEREAIVTNIFAEESDEADIEDETAAKPSKQTPKYTG